MTDTDRHSFRHAPQARSCLICGQSAPGHIEQHDVAGLRVALCRRCYGRLIARATPLPEAIWTPPDNLESIARAMLAEADLLSMMAQSRWLLAHVLIDRVRRDAPNKDDTGG